jgi:hypothetical protein
MTKVIKDAWYHERDRRLIVGVLKGRYPLRSKTEACPFQREVGVAILLMYAFLPAGSTKITNPSAFPIAPKALLQQLDTNITKKSYK